MNRELQRSVIKNILHEMNDAAVPMNKLTVRAISEDWDEDKFEKELLKAVGEIDITKTFDYYTDRIMSVFEENN